MADIGEINEATFTSSERDAFRAASEAIEADYAILIDYAKMVGLEDIDKYLTKSSKAENEVNQSYLSALADSKEIEWQFAQRHTTAKKPKGFRLLEISYSWLKITGICLPSLKPTTCQKNWE